MNRVLTLAIWLVPTVAVLTPAAVLNPVAQANADPLLACINAAVLKLDGVPRSEITASLAGSGSGAQEVNWQAKNGSSGFCQVGETGQVTQIQVEVAVEQANPVRALTPAVSGVAPGTQVWVNTTAGVINVRSSPGGEVVGSAANGSPLTMTGKTDGEWVEVTGGKWVSQYLLTTYQASPIAAAGEAAPSIAQSTAGGSQIATPDGGGVNLRQTPGGEVIGGLADGTTVRLTGQTEGNWAEIEGGGWVSVDYLR